jgi:WD40 repeat protein/serine/threonine protein kinase
MTTELKIEELFATALDLEPERRSAFLDQSCHDDSLRKEIESLIEAYEKSGDFLDKPIVNDLKPSDPLIGRSLGDFIIREKIGEGGFGVVYKAEQITLAREAVIKVLHGKHSANKELIESFLDEARLASRLEHPYTAHVYAFGAESDGLMWIAMEMVHGTPLDILLKTQGPLQLEEFVPLLDKICEVVHTAHEYSTIHRDIKPANVMVIERAGKLLPKLLDFGIAKVLDQELAPDAKIRVSIAPDAPGVTTSEISAVQTVGIVGSPAYMAPELWSRSEIADARVDIYALGVLAYKTLTGNVPFEGSANDLYQAHLSSLVPPLGHSFPSALDKVIAKAMAKQPEDRYSTAIEFAATFREAAGFIEKRLRLTKDRAPYIGLKSFLPEDADIFFGREREIEILLNRLQSQPLLAVIGPSGAGKSSFVQAGAIPNLPATWRAITVRPGSTPLSTLASQLARENIDSVGLRTALESNSDSLRESLKSAATAFKCTFVLVVDQFEELFTLCKDPAERKLYAEGLARAALSIEDPVRVVLTLRDDFLMRAERLFGDRLARGLQLLNTPERDDLMRILTEPARLAGFEFEDRDLPQEIIDSVIEQQGALPLLAFTAARLWELRDPDCKQMQRKAYEEMGGVGGALAKHAESMMSEMTGEEKRLVREAFRHLVTSEGTRALLTRAELMQVIDSNEDTVIEKLIGARLITASEGEGGIERIEIIHEALLSSWPRLMKWRQEDEEGARLRDQLRTAAKQWEERGRVKGLLWRDEALTEYKLWRSRYPGKLTESEDAFGVASLSEALQNQRTRRVGAVALFMILLAGLLILIWQRQLTEQNARNALIEKERAEKIAEEYKRANELTEEQRQLAERNETEAKLQSDLAKQSTQQVERQLLEIFEDRGRQELLVDNPLLASVYLSEAYSKGVKTSSLRFILAESLRALDAQLVTINGHTKEVQSARFSPDGNLIVTSGRDKSVKVWDGASGGFVSEFDGNREGINHAAFSPDGTRIVMAGDDGTVKIWNRTGNRSLVSLDGHKAKVNSAEFSYDGSRIVTADGDGIARILDAEGGKLLISLNAHKGNARSVEFSRDGARVLTAGDDNAARIWDATSGRLLFSLDGHAEGVSEARFSSDGTRIVTASDDNTAKVWDATNGRLIVSLEGHKDGVNSASFNPDGSRVVTASNDYTVKLWNATSGKSVATFEGHKGKVLSAMLSPNGNRIVTASSDGTAKIWNATNDKLLSSFENSKLTAIHGGFSSEGTRIFTAGNDYVVKVLDGTGKKILLSLEGHTYNISTAEYSADGKRIVTASDDDTVIVWDATSGKKLVTLSGNRAAFSPDGSRTVTANSDKSAKVWDNASGKLLASFEGHTGGVNSARFSPDGTCIVTASNDRTAKVWRAGTRKLLVTLEGHSGAVTSAFFSPDGRQIVTASDDNTAKIWDAVSGRQLASLGGHKARVYSAEFSPDGALIITASKDKTAKIWDSSAGRLLASLDDHKSWVVSARFSPDGTRVATTSRDKVVKIWDVHPENRKPEDVSRLVKRLVPFRLDQSRLVPTGSK